MQNPIIRIRRRTLVLGALGTGALGLSPLALAQQKFVNVLTGGQSGVYYPMGVALSQIYGKVLPDAKVTVQSTKASAENLNLLQAGRGEMALTLGDALSDAWKGDKEAGFNDAADEAARGGRHVSELHPDRRQRRFGHQDAGRPEGQAHLGRRAEVRHRAERACDAEGRRADVQRLRQGRVPAVRRIGRADEEPPARRRRCSRPAWAWPRSATWPPR